MSAAAGMSGMDGQGVYDYPGQLSGLEAFDFGLDGLGMGVDSAITGLFMENSTLWGANAMPGAFFGGWHG